MKAQIMKLVLHIGQSKTGTTSLQEFLRLNRSNLREQGVLYPDYYQKNVPLNTLNHNSLAEELCGFSRYPRLSTKEYFAQITEQAESFNCHTVILSGESFLGAPQVWRTEEDFFTAHQEKLNVLKNHINGYEIHLVAYLRCQEDWFNSAITQIIRYEGLLEKPVYKSDAQLLKFLEPHLNYNALLKLWKDTLQPSKMFILPYERKKMVQRNTIYDFIHHIGIDKGELSFDIKKSQEHKTLDRRYMEVKKELNKSPHSKTTERVIIECLNYLNNELPSIETYQMSPEISSEIKKQFSDANNELARVYGQPQNNETEFFSQKDDANENLLPPLSQAEIDKAMGKFLKRYKSCVMRKTYIVMFSKAFLRNNFPMVHALLRRTYLNFSKKT